MSRDCIELVVRELVMEAFEGADRKPFPRVTCCWEELPVGMGAL